MKFEYETSSEEREVVACIDCEGNLLLRRYDNDGYGHYELTKDGETNTYESISFDYELEKSQKVFYRGDKLTITF